jgi:hypothetical protein
MPWATACRHRKLSADDLSSMLNVVDGLVDKSRLRAMAGDLGRRLSTALSVRMNLQLTPTDPRRPRMSVAGRPDTPYQAVDEEYDSCCDSKH